MAILSLLAWFLSTAVGLGSRPSIAGGGPVAHSKTTAASTAGVRNDIAGGGPVAKKKS